MTGECPECGSANLDQHSQHEFLCNECGRIIEETPKSSGGRDNTSEPKSNITYSTGASAANRFKGNIAASAPWRTASNTTERNLIYALNELDRISDSLGLTTEVRTKAMSIYKEVVKKDILWGRSIKGFIAAAIYVACRIYGLGITTLEVKRTSGVERGTLNNCYKCIIKELGMDVTPRDPIDILYVVSRKLCLGGKITEMAIGYLKIALDKGLTSGKIPGGISAASLYLASRATEEKRTQRELSVAFGVTEATIRNRCRELERYV